MTIAGEVLLADSGSLYLEVGASAPVKVVLADGPLGAEVARAPGQKCERCWVFAEDLGKDPGHPTVCGKCAEALQ